MSRRGKSEEIGFGSDSFLDIIANIVGILIILIVVAGVRVSQAPIVRPAQAASITKADVPAEAHSVSDISLPALPVAAPKPVPDVSGELKRTIARLETDLAEMEQRRSENGSLIRQLSQREEETQQTIRTTLLSIRNQTDDVKQVQGRLQLIRDEIAKKESKLVTLRQQLEVAEEQTSPVKQIRHQVNPLAHQVAGKELHFRISGGRIAFVPLNELLEHLRSQVLRQKDWLVKFHRHQGQVGPIQGFTMHYVVERQRLGVLEELRQGSGMVRIGVSEWRIQPEPDLATESVREALRADSKFVYALRSAEPRTTLTFWVYPDSFRAYRQLQKFVRDEGFTVAARPLPFGIPIAGSPHGTRSSGQ